MDRSARADERWRALYRWSITEGLRRSIWTRDRRDRARHDQHAAGDQVARSRGIYLLLDAMPYLGSPPRSACCARFSSAGAARAHVVMSATRSNCRRLEALSRAFLAAAADENALLKMIQDESASPAENAGRRCEVDRPRCRSGSQPARLGWRSTADRAAPDLPRRALGEADLPEMANSVRVSQKSGHLHFEYDTARFSDIAGLARMKSGSAAARCFRRRKRAARLDPPKGVLLLGVQAAASRGREGHRRRPGVPWCDWISARFQQFHGETERICATRSFRPTARACVL